MNATCLIGSTGFLGGNLLKQEHFDVLLHSKDLESGLNRHFSRLYLACLPAEKWRANQQPEEDKANLERVCTVLKTMSADFTVLFSTIDVFSNPSLELDERHLPTPSNLQPYGKHRLIFEEFVRQHFPKTLIVRLPAVFGSGLKKNALFDLVHGIRLEHLNPESRFQWYAASRLSEDVHMAEKRNLTLLHLFPEPVSMGQIIETFFPHHLSAQRQMRGQVAHYAMRTRHGLAPNCPYYYDQPTVVASLQRYIETLV